MLMAATTISAAMRTMTIHSRYSPAGGKSESQHMDFDFSFESYNAFSPCV